MPTTQPPILVKEPDLAAQQARVTTSAAIAQLVRTLVVTRIALIRIAARAGWKVLRYQIKEGERLGSGASLPGDWIATVEIPEGRGQIAFYFTAEEGAALAGIAQSSPYPVAYKDVVSHDFEALVRAVLACFPGALPAPDACPWSGQDGGAVMHLELLGSV